MVILWLTNGDFIVRGGGGWVRNGDYEYNGIVTRHLEDRDIFSDYDDDEASGDEASGYQRHSITPRFKYEYDPDFFSEYDDDEASGYQTKY